MSRGRIVQIVVLLLVSACAGRGAGSATQPSSVAPVPSPTPESHSHGHRYSRQAIDAVMRENLARIQRCYEKGLLKNRRLGGKVIVRFEFGLSGRVDASAIGSSELKGRRKAEVETCIVDVVLDLEFPPPETRVIVNYPLMFKSR